PDGFPGRQRIRDGERRSRRLPPDHRARLQDHEPVRPGPAHLRVPPLPAGAPRRAASPGRRPGLANAAAADAAAQQRAHDRPQLSPPAEDLMTPEQAVRVAIAVLLGLGAALVFDRLAPARGRQPPGFRVPWRRWLALAVLAGLLAVGVFAPVASLGVGAEPDFSKIRTPPLLALPLRVRITMPACFLLAFAGRAARPHPLPEPAAPAALPLHEAEILDPEGMP